ncbi:cell wall-binding repeat-containing protein [Clostridium sp. CX1]|uniref:cell wall-binding repeat-containing protein n=1 Tax=Clostridium sp. CX1 TaxID=2978346 RepID=UPI0021C14AD0|nr:cell wall-binding repeat-containing protein [Clostridium sp. CX1]MCT8974979.1 cell wall-binding repeat-containing protein [Clostridium sp. CX1]
MRKRLLSIIFTVTLSCAMFFTSNVVNAATLQDRLWGTDRYQTNSKIVDSGWTSSEYAVIASGEGFADALCASPLAEQYKAPILLTGKDALSTETRNQLSRLKVKKVFIVGGRGVVSDNVKSEIEDMGIETTRIYGQDRFETSVEVAKNLKNVCGVVITNGYGFADALSITSIASKKSMPILLTDKEDLPEATKDFLANKKLAENYILGGIGVVSTKIDSYLSNPIRLGGNSRYETNAAVLNHFADKFSYNKVYVASGEGYADALSGSVLAASSNSPLILVGSSVDYSVMASIRAQRDKYNNIIVLGGTGVVSDNTVNIIINSDYVKNLKYTLGNIDGTYTGCVVNNAPNGYGSFYAQGNKSSFKEQQEETDKIFTISGSWSDGHINSKEIMTFSVGNKSDNTESITVNSDYVENLNYTLGSQNGTYTGCVVNNLPNGFGSFSAQEPKAIFVGQTGNGAKYTISGIWANGHINSKGTIIRSDYNAYMGDFKNDKAEGQGTYIWLDGSKYIGEFKNGKMEGQGTMTWMSGVKYIGPFKNGAMEGEGTVISPNGEQYIGVFEEGHLVSKKGQ